MSESVIHSLSKNLLQAVFAVSLTFPVLPSVAADRNPVVLENEQLRLEVASDNGALARLVDKRGPINLAPVGGLADNFRLILRDAGKRFADKGDKVILGRNQKVASIEKTGNRLNLTWNGPLADSEGGLHEISARMEIRLAGAELKFRFFLQNDSACKVAEAWYPLIGGLAKFGRGQEQGGASVMLPTPSPTIKRLTIPFGEMAMHYPDQMNMSYSSVCDESTRRAVYFASHDPIARLKYYRFFEQSSPQGTDIFACIAHKPFTPKGKSFEGSPVVLRFHDGDWKAAGPIYREWFVKAFGVLDPSKQWIRQQSFFQDTMFILPEGTLNMTFKDIPRWAKDARDPMQQPQKLTLTARTRVTTFGWLS